MKLDDIPNLPNRPLMGLISELGELTKSSSMSMTESGASVSDDVSDVYSLVSSIRDQQKVDGSGRQGWLENDHGETGSG